MKTPNSTNQIRIETLSPGARHGAGCYNYSEELAILREEGLLLAILVGR